MVGMHFTPCPDQLTVGALIDALDRLDPELPVHLAGFGMASAPFALGRHRAHTDGLAIHALHSQDPWRVRRLASALRRRIEGRPDDRYTPTLDTPMWVQPLKVLEFKAVTSVQETKRHAVIRHTDLAPALGPSVQRLTDEQARARLRETGGPLAEPVERYLLRTAARDWSETRHRLQEAREQITALEAQVARDLKSLAQTEYQLGITDQRP